MVDRKGSERLYPSNLSGIDAGVDEVVRLTVTWLAVRWATPQNGTVRGMATTRLLHTATQ
jgi:hypothetical protein